MNHITTTILQSFPNENRMKAASSILLEVLDIGLGDEVELRQTTCVVGDW